jgi:choline dehydrogenase-like flavoprotein
MSLPQENKIWDYIIVGSGPSGGRIAHDLVKKGAAVLLLEAGPFFRAKDFPKPEIKSSSQMFWGGGVELNHDARLGFLRAKCVGGTSIVNQALLDRFDDLVWSEWKQLSGVNFSDSQMDPHYLAVENSLSLQKIQEKDFGRNTKLFIKAFEKKGLGWTPLRRGQKDCGLEKGNDCIACLGGCPRSSKQSTLVTAVEPALQSGLEILAGCEVQSLTENSGQISIQAHFKNHLGSQKISLKAKSAVLAAGSFGTTKILLQSGLQNRLPALGEGIACHPQYMTYGLFENDGPIDAFKGAFQAVKSYDPGLREKGLKFENVFAPPIATSMLMTGFGSEHQRLMQKYRFMASMEVAIRDEASGKISLGKNGKMTVTKSFSRGDQGKLDLGMKMISEMFESVGAEKIIRCHQAFGLHLMGGCALGAEAKSSVVGHDFRVHGSKNIFIADSSIFPSAPGLNPSLTVMALSHMAMPAIIKGNA